MNGSQVMSTPRPGKARAQGQWRGLGGIAAVLVLVAIAAVLRLVAGPSPDAGPVPTALAAEAAGSAVAAGSAGATKPGAPARSAAELEAGQRAAQAAAARAAGDEAPSATPAVRPDYVSEMEWQVLQGVAARSADPARELRRLVDKLRFSKQLDAWRASMDAAERRLLATRLLDELPAQVRHGDYARADAERLQQELLVVLEPEPSARAVRAERERARLGTALLQPGR